jgi:O-antigen ligase
LRTDPRVNYRWLALWLLAALVASIPSENGVTIPGVGSLARLIGMLAFAVAAVALLDGDRFRIRLPSLFLVLALLFTIWSMASYFWSWAPLATLGELTTLVQLFALSWLIWQLCGSRKDRLLLLQAFVLGCYVAIAVALAVLFSGVDPGYRNVGAFNPNGFAIVSSLAVPMAWLLAVHRHNALLHWLNMLYPAFAVVAVILSASRGGFLTLLVALSVIPLTQLRIGVWRRLVVLLLVLGTTWVAFVQAPRIYPELERNLTRLSETREELASGTLTGRRVIWDAGMKLFNSSPLVGIGVGSFNTAVAPLIGKPKGPHNAFVSIAVGSGVVGLLLFVGMLSTAALSTLLADERDRVFFVVLLAALLVGMMPTNSEHDKFVWFILALLTTQSPVIFRSSSWLLSRTPERDRESVGLDGSGIQ